MGMKELTKKIILFLVKKLGRNIEGRKKLMKLMFLIDHYDVELGKIKKSSLLGNEYFIYYYGVFSFDVMTSYNELVKEGKIRDSFPITTNVEVVKLPEEIREKVEKIIQKFGHLSGYELEIRTLKLLGIQPYEKERYFGKGVSEIV